VSKIFDDRRTFDTRFDDLRRSSTFVDGPSLAVGV